MISSQNPHRPSRTGDGHPNDIFVLRLADELGDDPKVRQGPLCIRNAHNAVHTSMGGVRALDGDEDDERRGKSPTSSRCQLREKGSDIKPRRVHLSFSLTFS